MGSIRPPANVSRAVNLSEDTATTGMFSNEEVQTLRRLLSQLESQSITIASPNFVNSGNAFLANLDNSFWVINFEANKHVTGSSNKFISYSPCSGKEKGCIADGSLSSISGIGAVKCTPNISLSSVLHMPSFPINLVCQFNHKSSKPQN